MSNAYREKITLVLLSLVASACGRHDDDGPSNALTADEQAYCDMIYAACERQIECGAVVINQEQSVEACADIDTCSKTLKAAKAAGGQIRTDDVASCRTAIDNASCEALANLHYEIAPACRTMLEGPAVEGESCDGGLLNGGCRAGLHCQFSDDTCPGTCVVGPCVGGDCSDDHYCSFGTCEPRAEAGAECDLPNLEQPWERTCVDGYHCQILEGDSFETRCVPQLAAGADCVYSDPYVCVDGHACIDQVCVPELVAGQECASYTDCTPGLTCDYGQDPPICATPAAEGQPCTDGVGACAAGLQCVEGTCGHELPMDPDLEPLLAPGAQCDQGGLCPLGQTCRCDDATTCASMHCIAGPGLGESCASVGEDGTFTPEFNPYYCSEGLCDFLGDYKCVKPNAPGENCSYDGQQYTLECVTAVCRDHVCLGFDELACSGL